MDRARTRQLFVSRWWCGAPLSPDHRMGRVLPETTGYIIASVESERLGGIRGLFFFDSFSIPPAPSSFAAWQARIVDFVARVCLRLAPGARECFATAWRTEEVAQVDNSLVVESSRIESLPRGQRDLENGPCIYIFLD